MKFAQKMILVPEEDYSMVIKAQAQAIPAETKKTIALNDAMKKVTSTKRNNICKSQTYQKLLRDYLHYKRKATQPAISLPDSSDSTMTRSNDFLNNLPALYRGKAHLLLTHLEKHGVKWSEKGELKLPSGNVIEGSHGTDLLREALVGSKSKSEERTIRGWDDFLANLVNTNVPTSLIGKKKTLQKLESIKNPRNFEQQEAQIKPNWLSL